MSEIILITTCALAIIGLFKSPQIIQALKAPELKKLETEKDVEIERIRSEREARVIEKVVKL